MPTVADVEIIAKTLGSILAGKRGVGMILRIE
jgi:hypothetical protein